MVEQVVTSLWQLGLCDEQGAAVDERGQRLDPPFYLVKDVVERKLLGVKVRRVQELIELGVLHAVKATREEELLLLRNGRVTCITERGIWLIEPGSILRAQLNKKPVGFPRGGTRSKRGTTTGAGEARR